MDDDFVLRATEIDRDLLTDLRSGVAPTGDECRRGSDHCGFHNFLLRRLD